MPRVRKYNSGLLQGIKNKKRMVLLMEKYLGVKMIEAEPMSKNAYNQKFKGVDTNEDDESGYVVKYEDGYISWSPKDTFEKAYKLTSGLSFGLAIDAMRSGNKVARSGWNGKGIFIELQIPDEHSKMTHPYIFIDTTGLQTDNASAPKNRVPWLASQTDMLSCDWKII